MRRIFVTGIGTGVGKTVVSAILTEALNADYWKPVQAGDLDDSDTEKVKRLVSNEVSRFHAEAFRLNHAMSPHAAAALDGIRIDLDEIRVPESNNHLVIEGAGGLLVPLGTHTLIIDLMEKLHAETVLVANNYLGSINHTLLSIEAIRNRNLNLIGMVFNGEANHDSEAQILEYTGVKCLGRVLWEEVSRSMVRKYALNFREI